MPKFNLDYSKLEKKVSKKTYKLADVKNQIEKVCFDLVRFRDDDEASNLWQVQSSDDGDYIVSLYEDDDAVKTASAKTWEVHLSKTANDLYVFYKGDPIVKMATSKLGIPSEDVKMVPRYLPKKLAENGKLVSSLLNQLSETTKQEVLTKYPELVEGV